MGVRTMPLKRLVWSALVSLTVGTTGCAIGSSGENSGQPPSPSSSPSPSPSGSLAASAADEAVAEVGGKKITRSELTERLLSGYGAEVLREMMLHEAVNQESAKLGFSADDEEIEREISGMSEGYGSEQEFYDSMLQQLGMDREAVKEDARYRVLLEKLTVRGIHVPESDIRRYYADHKKEYGPRKQYELAWILTGTEKEANEVLGKLEAGTDFAALAKQYSMDGMTADSGGNLGWVDETDPLQDAKLISAASRIQVGEAAGPIQTDQGYVVLLLNGRKIVEGKDYESVKDEIARRLALEKAPSMHDLEQSLLAKYQAKTLDPKLKLPSER
ncbi:peptidyl-prolyl cis-trans isomerase [Cohnella candidum]|uniref:peptidylprolyl isomerase n=1 Tax=Cohnella candidum TaxID=2674991 RepID=A0A3G3K3M4_9BACL|nr:peptidyl-prolyl cis-trans isomerase [Cohnella candidum]AYQ74637.1 hypothetical protein EAV92_19925 [Cohnella candidum]